MPDLAAGMKRLGIRPGIWMRPTALMTVDDPRRLRAGPCTAQEKPLDLTLPENLALIHDDVARIRSWGYELIKHDFSTYDVFARWGFEMGAELTESGWHFQDQSLTNAEIILCLYCTLRTAAGDAILLGCNTIGHLGAGLFELQRPGDDTSGLNWERTRRMGIKTLAFRLPQHGTFFASDPDCAALPGRRRGNATANISTSSPAAARHCSFQWIRGRSSPGKRPLFATPCKLSCPAALRAIASRSTGCTPRLRGFGVSAGSRSPTTGKSPPAPTRGA